MTTAKLLNLYNKEKTRITEEVINPIIEVINTPKYDEFFNFYLAIYINRQIDKKMIDIPFIDSIDPNEIKNELNKEIYKDLYQEIINKILETSYLDIFKVVFGEQNYKTWALAYYKFIQYVYFESKNLTNIRHRILTGDTNFDINSLLNKSHFDNINAILFKSLYGYTFTSICSFEYWQKTTKISKKDFNSFIKIVNANNPSIYLVNAVLYFYKNKKDEFYKNQTFHSFKSFDFTEQISITDKTLAQNWILDYMSALSLNQKITIGLWKAIQNLVFGTKSGSSVVVMRTISEIMVNIASNWRLDEKSQLFFDYLKLQVLFDQPIPKTFDLFVSQNQNILVSQIEPLKRKFENIKKNS